MYVKIILSESTGFIRAGQLDTLPEIGLFLLLHKIIMAMNELHNDLLFESDRSLLDFCTSMMAKTQSEYDQVVLKLKELGIDKENGDLKKWFYWWDNEDRLPQALYDELETKIANGEDISSYVPKDDWRTQDTFNIDPKLRKKIEALPEAGLFLLLDGKFPKMYRCGAGSHLTPLYHFVMSLLEKRGITEENGKLTKWFEWWDLQMLPYAKRKVIARHILRGEDISVYMPAGSWKDEK